MDGIAARCEYGGEKPVTDIAEYAVAAFAVVPALILDDHRRAPVQVRNQIERQGAAYDIGSILGRIVSDLDSIIVSTIKGSRNAGLSRLITGLTCLPGVRRESETAADQVKELLGTENLARQLAGKTRQILVARHQRICLPGQHLLRKHHIEHIPLRRRCNESRRWRHGDSLTTHINDTLWSIPA